MDWVNDLKTAAAVLRPSNPWAVKAVAKIAVTLSKSQRAHLCAAYSGRPGER
jgi:hypothetical protein